jgi:hypothetical protein
MSTLTGSFISNTYQSLLKFFDNGGVTATPKQITDGLGVSTPLYVSTDGVGVNTPTINPSAAFQVDSTTKGYLMPRLTTTQRNAIATPATGLLIYNTTTNSLDYYNGTSWVVTQTGTVSYGSWQDFVTQTAAVNNTGYATILRTTDFATGVSVITDGTNLTKITFANSGVYNLQFSFQFQNTDNAEQDVTIWLRKNAITTAGDVTGSAGFLSVPKTHGGGSGTPGHMIAGWNYLLQVTAGDYFQLVWSTSNAAAVRMQYYPAGSPPPAAASAIVTVTQIA